MTLARDFGNAPSVPEIAYVNGQFLPLEQATIHVEDRGFQFADAVYEVFRTYAGRPFAVADHLRRLERSLSAINLQAGKSDAELEALIAEAARRAAFPEAMIYLQISRGQAKRHRGVPAQSAPTVVITVRALEDTTALRQKGVTLITHPDLRWARCDIKSVGLLANVLAYQAAKQAGANDALFCEADGRVNEATAGNVFLVVRGSLITPANGPRLLAGVTRDKILHSVRAAGISAVEQIVRQEELFRADEIFLTSTTAEVVPVVAIDGRRIGTGVPGPMAERVYETFSRHYIRG